MPFVSESRDGGLFFSLTYSAGFFKINSLPDFFSKDALNTIDVPVENSGPIICFFSSDISDAHCENMNFLCFKFHGTHYNQVMG